MIRWCSRYVGTIVVDKRRLWWVHRRRLESRHTHWSVYSFIGISSDQYGFLWLNLHHRWWQVCIVIERGRVQVWRTIVSRKRRYFGVCLWWWIFPGHRLRRWLWAINLFIWVHATPSIFIKPIFQWWRGNCIRIMVSVFSNRMTAHHIISRTSVVTAMIIITGTITTSHRQSQSYRSSRLCWIGRICTLQWCSSSTWFRALLFGWIVTHGEKICQKWFLQI